MHNVMIITGTSKGIGNYLGNYYLGKGYVVVGCSRGAETITHSNYEHFILDVADEQAVVKMVRGVAKKYGKIDVLINNAGIASMNHFLLSPLSKIEEIYKTNVIGTFLFSREVGKIMSKKRNGRIVNFSTIAVPLKLEGELMYASSKNAVVNMTQIMAKELGTYNITCNAVGPTPVLTDLIKNVPEEKIQHIIRQQAIKRHGEFRDVANVIDFFIKPESDFITGQVVYLGGVS